MKPMSSISRYTHIFNFLEIHSYKPLFIEVGQPKASGCRLSYRKHASYLFNRPFWRKGKGPKAEGDLQALKSSQDVKGDPGTIINSLQKKSYNLSGRRWLLVIHNYLEILRQFHETPITGHLGFVKTYGRIRRWFYWPQILKDDRHTEDCHRRMAMPQRSPGR